MESESKFKYSVNTSVKINVAQIVGILCFIAINAFIILIGFFHEPTPKTGKEDMFATVEMLSDESGDPYEYYTVFADEADDKAIVTVIPYISIAVSGSVYTIVVSSLVSQSTGMFDDGKYSFRVRDLLPQLLDEITEKTSLNLNNVDYGVAVKITFSDGDESGSYYYLGRGTIKPLPEDLKSSLSSTCYKIDARDKNVEENLISTVSEILFGGY